MANFTGSQLRSKIAGKRKIVSACNFLPIEPKEETSMKTRKKMYTSYILPKLQDGEEGSPTEKSTMLQV